MPRSLKDVIAHIRAVAGDASISTTLIQTEDLLALCDAAEGGGAVELERLVARKSRPWFRRWCVTVMDNWTPTRVFWTQAGAAKFRKEHSQCAYLYQWQRDRWVLVEGAF